MSPRAAGAVRPLFIRKKGGRVPFGPSENGGVMGGGASAELTLTIPRQQRNEKSSKHEPNRETASGTRKSNSVSRRRAPIGFLCCYRSPSSPRPRNLLLLYATIACIAAATDTNPGGATGDNTSKCGLIDREEGDEVSLFDGLVRLPSGEWIEENLNRGIQVMNETKPEGCATPQELLEELVKFARTDGLGIAAEGFCAQFLQQIIVHAIRYKTRSSVGWLLEGMVRNSDFWTGTCDIFSAHWTFLNKIGMYYSDRQQLCRNLEQAVKEKDIFRKDNAALEEKQKKVAEEQSARKRERSPSPGGRRRPTQQQLVRKRK